MVVRPVLASVLLLAASPVSAAGSAQVPEGSNLTLFALGIAGVLIGRHASSRRKRD
jgi:hypothetical protein